LRLKKVPPAFLKRHAVTLEIPELRQPFADAVALGIFLRKSNVTAFCATTQALVSGELSSSSQRYGSATETPL